MKRKPKQTKSSPAKKGSTNRGLKTQNIYQLKITLDKSRPPIWRRVIVGENSTLADLHAIIQGAMGWSDSHLHDFQIDKTRYGVPSDDDYEPVIDERRVRLSSVAANVNMRFIYTYDFGDDWRHTIVVEKIMQEETCLSPPRCIEGAGACPPEDCGGIYGYEELIEALRDPKHERHEELLDWCGKFEPDAFDLERANEAVTSCIR